ncbi:hypothetical protein [Alkalihalophilus marmarensis]|uniref:hypothetical protein n=1 Tax=Alkalihalophilus marmarensis TaxID=521377 RepID=UPI002E1F6915|nr:hypothetical protein [Alkalihalophilus marmarensis]
MKFGNGGIKFGLKPHKPFDNSVKTYTLSPEELEKYTEGKPVLTKDKYLERKGEGKTDHQIMKEFEMNNVSLISFKKKHDLLGIRKPRNAGDQDDWKTKYEVLEARFKELEQQLTEPAETEEEEKLVKQVEELNKKLEEERKEFWILEEALQEAVQKKDELFLNLQQEKEAHEELKYKTSELQDLLSDYEKGRTPNSEQELERLQKENHLLKGTLKVVL